MILDDTTVEVRILECMEEVRQNTPWDVDDTTKVLDEWSMLVGGTTVEVRILVGQNSGTVDVEMKKNCWQEQGQNHVNKKHDDGRSQVVENKVDDDDIMREKVKMKKTDQLIRGVIERNDQEKRKGEQKKNEDVG